MAVKTEGDRSDCAFVRKEGGQSVTIGDIPYGYKTFQVGTGKQVSIRTEGYCCHPILMLQRTEMKAASYVPHSYSITGIRTHDSKQMPIITQGRSSYIIFLWK